MKFSSVIFSVTHLAAVTSGHGLSRRGTILWDGRFNDLTSAEDLNNWSWSNQVGPYQYYIHGSGSVTDYINLSSDYKNPADTTSKQGAKMTLDSTAYWNGQTMRRIELVPQTKAAINSGKVYYHFSMMRTDVNPPAETREHQIMFFESHFTEMKAGWLSGASGTTDPALRWMVSSQTQWSANWTAGVWHNVAYEIDFAANTAGFWHSTGGDALTQVVAPVSASTSSNGADFHVGVLELPRDGYADAVEDIYVSGVFIESGEITTVIGGGSTSSGDSASNQSAVESVATATTPASTSIPSSSAVSTAVPTPATVPISSALPASSGTSTTATSSAPVATASGGTITRCKRSKKFRKSTNIHH